MSGITSDAEFEYCFFTPFNSAHELFSGKEQLLFQYNGVTSRKKIDPRGSINAFRLKVCLLELSNFSFCYIQQ